MSGRRSRRIAPSKAVPASTNINLAANAGGKRKREAVEFEGEVELIDGRKGIVHGRLK